MYCTNAEQVPLRPPRPRNCPGPSTPAGVPEKNRPTTQPGEVCYMKSCIRRRINLALVLLAAALLSFQAAVASSPQSASPSSAARAQDPGVRGSVAAAGEAIPGLTAYESEYFNVGLKEFAQEEAVEEGLGPRMNLDSCGGCHFQPSVGGTSPSVNPQV